MTTSSPIRSPRFLRGLLLIALGAVVLRVAVGYLLNLDPHSGTIRGYPFYLQMAKRFLSGKGLSWTFYLRMGDKWANRPPGYPLLLALSLEMGFWPLSALLLQSLVGALAAVGAGLLGRSLAGPAAGLLAAAGTACYPYFVSLDTALLEHGMLTVAVAFTALSFASAVRRRSVWLAVMTGLVAAAGVLVRVSFAAAVPVVLLAFLPAVGFRRGIRFAAAGALAAGLVLLPWVARNWRVVGHPVLSSDMGRALWVGNNDFTYRFYPDMSIDIAENRAFRSLPGKERARILALRGDEVAQSVYFRTLALERIRSRPKEFFRGMLVKLGAFFSPVLNPVSDPLGFKELIYGLTYGFVLVSGLLGFVLLRRKWRLWLSIPAMFLAFMATAAVFWGESRHRAPLDVLLIVGTAAVLARIGRREGVSSVGPEASQDRDGFEIA